MPDLDPSAELARRAAEASVAYEDNIFLRSAVVAIPGIGSIMDLVLSSGGQASRERVHKLLNAMKDDMQERMDTIEDTVLDQEYLESEEFRDLLMRALDATIKTRDEAKRRVYARILTESTIRFAREGRSPEEYLDLIADLTPREWHVARMLHRDWPGEGYGNREPEEVNEAWRGWQDRVHDKLGVDAADLQLILGRLRSSGLVTESISSFPIGGGPVRDLPQYWIAPPFEKLMRFLERRRDEALEA
jgi:hypothetical protein